MGSQRSRPGGRQGAGPIKGAPGVGAGAWLPWPLVEIVCRLELRPPSVWQVFLAVLATWARYGRKEARLTVEDLEAMTGLSKRTVKATLAQLLGRGLLARNGRYGRLAVVLGGQGGTAEGADGPGEEGRSEGAAGGVSLSAPRRCRQACPPPTSVYCSSNKELVSGRSATFTARQRGVITDVLAKATELLGADAADLPLDAADAGKLGLLVGTTFGEAWRAINGGGDRARAGRFVRAALSLRHDPRVQGCELDLGP